MGQTDGRIALLQHAPLGRGHNNVANDAKCPNIIKILFLNYVCTYVFIMKNVQKFLNVKNVKSNKNKKRKNVFTSMHRRAFRSRHGNGNLGGVVMRPFDTLL